MQLGMENFGDKAWGSMTRSASLPAAEYELIGPDLRDVGTANAGNTAEVVEDVWRSS